MIASCFSALTETLPEGCLLVSRAGEIVAANRSAAAMLATGRAALPGRRFAELVSDPEETVERYLRACLQSREPIAGELHRQPAQGPPLAWGVSGNLLPSETPDGPPFIFLRCEPHADALAEQGLRAANERFQLVLDSLDALVYVADLKTYELLMLNRYGREQWGDTVGRRCWETLQSGQTGPCSFCTNSRLLLPNGEPAAPVVWEIQNTVTGRWFECRDQALRWPDGRMVRMEIATDITERRRAEQALARVASEWSTALDASTDVLYFLDVDRRVVRANAAFYAMTGGAPATTVGRHIAQIVHPHGEASPCPVCRAQEEKRDLVTVMEADHPDNPSGQPLEIAVRIVRDAAGEPSGIFMALHDLSHDRKAQEEKARLETQLANLVESSDDAIFSLKLDGTIVTWNKGAEKIYGHPAPEILGQSIAAILPFRESAGALQILERIRRGEHIDHFETVHVGRDGAEIPVSLSVSPLRDARGALTGASAISRDIAEQKRSEAMIRNILESVDEGFVVVGRDYRITSANRAYGEQSGKPVAEIVGAHCYAISHGATGPCHERGETCPVSLTFATGKPAAVVHNHLCQGGESHSVEIKSFPIRDLGGTVIAAIEVTTNITERINLEDQLRQAQKMEAVGILAGGVAHDFNNILSAIIGYATLLKMKLGGDGVLQKYVEQILASSDRAAGLTRSLLAFSRKQVVDLKPVILNDIVYGFHKILARLIGEDIEFTLNLAADTMVVSADKGQLEQLLMNLVTNARDAMPGGGKLHIATERAFFPAGYGEIPPGAYALLSVADAGVGMSQQTREHIFEPFYTTKEQGRGTGLGLAIVYGIVLKHKGVIHVSSEPARGATFKIYLPLLAAVAKAVGPEPLAPLPAGEETILLVEDDAAVRNVTKAMLEAYGYTVLEAADGGQAVRVFHENRDRVRLVLCDLILPGRNGREVCEEISAISPGIKVIYVSGYTADIIAQKGILEEGLNLIFKPLSPAVLLKKLREVLEAEGWGVPARTTGRSPLTPAGTPGPPG